MAFIGKEACTLGNDQNLWGGKKSPMLLKKEENISESRSQRKQKNVYKN